MEDISSHCLECGSKRRFYHCWDWDRANGDGPYLVTCRDCKNPYRTFVKPKGDLERDTKPE